tara:strand:- start:1559 stop:2218 length:660 start_codon:yes stop_codon:yes gene_type:complete
MALPTYLSLVNDVLVRLREPEVTTINENVLSKLVSKFVNDAKRQVEDSYNWNALTSTLTAETTDDVFNYVLVGSGARFKVIEVFNASDRHFLVPKSSRQMTQNFIGSAVPQTGSPIFYNFNGINNDGDTQVDLFPVPNKEYTIFFNLFIPQEEMTTDADTMLVPKEPVVLLALARSLVERGEDGGLTTSESYALFKNVLGDYIAIESSRYIEEEIWIGT